MATRTRVLQMLVGGATVCLLYGCATTPETPWDQHVDVPMTVADEPALLFSGFRGFNDLKGTVPSTVNGGQILVISDLRLEDWSGWYRQWSPACRTAPFNTLIVQVEGADSIESDMSKMMKWFVQGPTSREDIPLVCVDQQKLSDQEDFVIPVEGDLEYPLPLDVTAKGQMCKIGLVLVPEARYGDVKIRARFVYREPRP